MEVFWGLGFALFHGELVDKPRFSAPVVSTNTRHVEGKFIQLARELSLRDLASLQID